MANTHRPVTHRFRSAARKMLPAWLLRLRSRYVLAKRRREFAGLSVEKAFSRVYAEGLWAEGFAAGQLSSGGGSDPALQAPYIQFVRDFIRDHAIDTVVDLGCGDFRIGRQVAFGIRYLGLDIVPGVVDLNQRLYGTETVKFSVSNILEDALPHGDLCLVRQVFQHLSNAEIQAALARLTQYRFALITEHVPVGEFLPNLDRPHGPDTRLYDHSGIVLDRDPFNCPCQIAHQSPMDGNTLMRTYLITSEK